MAINWAKRIWAKRIRGRQPLPNGAGPVAGTAQVSPDDDLPTSVVRRGIVVTHGVGEQKRAEQLDTVVEPLVWFLGQTLGPENVQLKVRTLLDDQGIARADIHILDPQTREVREAWQVREAWWAESFRPSESGSIFGWAVIAAGFHVRSTARYVVWANIKAALGGSQQGVGVWQIPRSGHWLYQGLNVINWLFLTAGYAAVYVIGAIVLLPVAIFLQLPLRSIWPEVVGNLQRSLVNLITGGIGDQHAMTNRRVAVAAAANTIATALWPFLAPEARRRRTYEYDTVTVIAHSGGCVVSFDALASGEVQRWLAEGPPQRRVTWVTVGSGLDLAWQMRARRKAWDHAFWHRRLDARVNWIDIYARYDPVPQGAAPKPMVRQLMGEPPHPYVSVRVANGDWPFTDHGAYWWHREEVLSRLVHAITDSHLGWEPLDERIGRYAEQRQPDGTYRPHPLAAAVQTAVEAGPAHRRAVAVKRFGAVCLFGLCAVLLFGEHWLTFLPCASATCVGQWLLDGLASLGLGPPWPDWLTGPLRWLAEPGHFGSPRQHAWVVGAAALVFGLMVLNIILRMMGNLRGWLFSK
jgi:hypothetical protein